MKKSSKSIIFLALILMITMSIPVATSEKFREGVLSAFSPVYELFALSEPTDLKEDLLPVVQKPVGKMPNVEAIAGRVIFRSPNSWNSSFWINVGYEDNQDYENDIIAKNSPVVVGDAAVGVVDYVGKKQSRVRLITDSGLVPSVRVSRGEEQNKYHFENLDKLVSFLNAHPEYFENIQTKETFEMMLKNIQKKLLEKKETWHLAKGEIQGQSHPLWRSDSQVLIGSGFNYNFEDDKGPARDLRTGEPIGDQKHFKVMPLIKINDLLVTTGMDGVFPEGLKVAIVTKIELLREGDFAYEIEAMPAIENLNELSWVYVIAPLGYDEKDQPPIR